MAYYEATTQALWLRNFIIRLRVDSISKTLIICYDNSIVVFLSRNNRSDSRSKQMNVKYMSFEKNVRDHQVAIEHTNTKLMIVDPMTKRLAPKLYKEHVENIRLISLSSV